jgi:hypothetical protein
MYTQLKISEHKHSGRLRPHEFTSYLPLALLVMFTGVILLFTSFTYVFADHPPPQGGSIGLTGTVPSKPPTVAAIITSPTDGQHFKSSPITVKGTCPANTLVEIFKNGIFAGSGSCDNGHFSFDIDLLFGKNVLTAIDYDALNQAGPTSNTVTIFYDSILPSAAPINLLNLSGAQLLLNTDSVYRGSFPGQQLNVPITIIGGTPPYAVNVQWGDASNKVIQRNDNQTFNADHAYQKPGTFKIALQASDSKNQAAFITVAAIINGQPSGITQNDNSKQTANKLLMLWPMYAISATLVISFWLGERREKKILGKPLSVTQKLQDSKPIPPVEPPAKPTS